jgi:hypothetical protein
MDQNDAFFRNPELQICKWINSDSFISLDGWRGKVVVMEVFQMLCTGCVAHGCHRYSGYLRCFRPKVLRYWGCTRCLNIRLR